MNTKKIHSILIVGIMLLSASFALFATVEAQPPFQSVKGILYIDNTSNPLAGYLIGDNPNILLRLGKIALKSKMFGLLGKRECILGQVQRICFSITNCLLLGKMTRRRMNKLD